MSLFSFDGVSMIGISREDKIRLSHHVIYHKLAGGFSVHGKTRFHPECKGYRLDNAISQLHLPSNN